MDRITHSYAQAMSRVVACEVAGFDHCAFIKKQPEK